MIIGLSGKMRSGKNTVASIIQYLIYKDKVKDSSLSLNSFLNSTFIGDSYSGFIQKSFAAKLKQIISILTGIPVEDLEKQEVKDSRLPECWHKFDDNNHYVEPDNVRELLQILGTDLLRNQLHPNVFVNALFVDYTTKKYSIGIDKYGHQTIVDKYPNWLITDVRFPNELQVIKDRGGIVIRVNRNNSLLRSVIHESETVLDNATFDYVIDNNGTIEELVIKVKEILIKENII